MAGSCSAFDSLLVQPTSSTGKSVFARETQLARQSTFQRRVFDCILFGFELDLLQLHMRTLDSVVDSFLVTESTMCFQTATSKRAVLSETLRNGTWPPALARKTSVTIVSHEEALAAGCKDIPRVGTRTAGRWRYSGRCFQTVQRFALLELLLARAAPDDLALIADVDEIASPSFVRLARACAPFPPYAGWASPDAHTGFLHLSVRQFRYGFHCDHGGGSWWKGPRLYLAGWLRGQLERTDAPSRRLTPKLFDALRPTGRGRDLPIADRGGWHLTSFGSGPEVIRKLTTFGAANKFGGHPASLAPERIEACRRDCLDLLTTPTARNVTMVPTPCDQLNRLSSVLRLKRRALPPELLRRHVGVSVPPARLLSPAVLRHTFLDDGMLPPPLLDHASDFPASWFAHLASAPPQWAAMPASLKTRGVALTLYRCAAPPAFASARPAPPAVLLYLLGERGPTMGRGVFEFAEEGDVGDVFIVGEATATPPPRLSGALHARACIEESSATHHLRWADVPLTAAGSHYSGRWCMQKLELLRHLPPDITHAVLLDADTYVLPGGIRLLGEELNALTPTQFLAAPRTDARDAWTMRNGTSVLGVPRRSEGINSGMLAVHLPRMRAFESAFCPGSPWWRCVLDEQPKGYNHIGGDQAMWNALLVTRPEVWRPLPCGTHLSIDTMRETVRRIAQDAGVAPCTPRRHAGHSVGAGQILSVALRRSGDDCLVAVAMNDARFGAVPRAARAWAHRSAVTHGAARLQPLARLVAALLSRPTDLIAHRALLDRFPCWCYGYIKSDGTPTFGAPPGTPGESGCHDLSYSDILESRATGTPMPPTEPLPTLVGQPTAGGRRLAADDVATSRPKPSFRAVSVGCDEPPKRARPPPAAAFCFAGQPRTFIHPAARRSLVRAIKGFGADAYVFLVLSDDDPGSSWAHPPVRASTTAVHAAMRSLRPVDSYYGPLSGLNMSAGYAAERRAACGMQPEGLTRAIGSRRFMQTFYETHAKLRAVHRQVTQYERAHVGFTFTWVVRMRPDTWFFGPLPAHCTLQQEHMTFPAGVTGCGYRPCMNDHMAFAPRALSTQYFHVVDAMASCDGLRAMSAHWSKYVLWRLLDAHVPLAEPSAVIPYTLLRPCANASLDAYYPECARWTSMGIEKNAGLVRYTDGSPLPHLEAYRQERARLYEVCRAAARATFPAFAAVDASGARARGLCAAKG